MRYLTVTGTLPLPHAPGSRGARALRFLAPRLRVGRVSFPPHPSPTAAAGVSRQQPRAGPLLLHGAARVREGGRSLAAAPPPPQVMPVAGVTMPVTRRRRRRPPFLTEKEAAMGSGRASSSVPAAGSHLGAALPCP